MTSIQTVPGQRRRPGTRVATANLDAGRRSMEYLRKLGYLVDKAEHWVALGSPLAKDKYIQEIVRQRQVLIDLMTHPDKWPLGRRAYWHVDLADHFLRFADLMILPPSPGQGGIRKDLFGFIDGIAFKPHEPGVVAVQWTSRQQIATHLREYRDDDEKAWNVARWLSAEGRQFLLLGWECREVPCKSREGMKRMWVCEERWVRKEDLG